MESWISSKKRLGANTDIERTNQYRSDPAKVQTIREGKTPLKYTVPSEFRRERERKRGDHKASRRLRSRSRSSSRTINFEPMFQIRRLKFPFSKLPSQILDVVAGLLKLLLDVQKHDIVRQQWVWQIRMMAR